MTDKEKIRDADEKGWMKWLYDIYKRTYYQHFCKTISINLSRHFGRSRGRRTERVMEKGYRIIYLDIMVRGLFVCQLPYKVLSFVPHRNRRVGEICFGETSNVKKQKVYYRIFK